MTEEQNGTRPPSRIPEFASIEEEAEWWDTHDITDYLDELRPVQLRVSPTFWSVYRMTLQLDLADWQELSQRASAQGSEPAELVARWVTDRLRHETPVGSATD